MPSARRSRTMSQPALSGQHQVENDGVELLRTGQLPAFVAILGPHAVMPRLAEALPQGLANHRLVFDDQQLHPQCSFRPVAQPTNLSDSNNVDFEAQYQTRAITEL